jgi:gentisate 1,2-dioxygenase
MERAMPRQSPSPTDLTKAHDLETLYGLLKPLNVGPGWNKPTPSLWDEPRKTFVPAHWRYAQAKAGLDAAGRLINTELAERRNLILYNPIPGNDYATTRTLLAAYQMILPAERARSHRHTPNALRLIVDAAPGAYTIVDGHKLSMAPGDVLLTPNWHWHGHGNEGKAAAYWIDFLDTPLIHALEPMFFEPHPETYQSATHEEGDSPMRLAWRDTIARLNVAVRTAGGPYGTQIPLDGRAMKTIGLAMMRLDAGVATAAHRTTANNIYAVALGRGVTTIDGEDFSWSRGDVLAAPAWRTHSHCASEDSVLFRVHDEPLLASLDLLRKSSV